MIDLSGTVEVKTPGPAENKRRISIWSLGSDARRGRFRTVESVTESSAGRGAFLKNWGFAPTQRSGREPRLYQKEPKERDWWSVVEPPRYGSLLMAREPSCDKAPAERLRPTLQFSCPVPSGRKT